MYKFILLMTILMISSALQISAQIISIDYLYNKYKADSLFYKKDFKKAIHKFRICYELKNDWRRVDYYYLSACYANLNEVDSAFKYLKVAINEGVHYNELNDTNMFINDSNFIALNNDERWNSITDGIRNNTINYINIVEDFDSILYNQLLERKKMDQKYRNYTSQSDSIIKEQKKIDIQNQIWLVNLIQINGFPSLNNFGFEACSSACLIAIHATNDLNFQELCLIKMKKLFYTSDIPSQYIALLQDKILYNRGEKQIFGTQLIAIDNKYTLYQTFDINKLNQRRKVMNLDIIENYLELFNKN